MFNFFPELLNYDFFAPTILRLALGGILIYETIKILQAENINWLLKILNIIGFLSGLLIILGLYTQIVALVVIARTLISHESKAQKILITAIALSLLLTGASAIALDWPL
ncbi:MAG: hypothetical protein AAB453_04935 [Patescibacteria group bacterium]